uniref:Uncharacterized protein n=1 Tax=Arundo donax TaxID=35708 RepID=A0A0A9CAF7_ARUDO
MYPYSHYFCNNLLLYYSFLSAQVPAMSFKQSCHQWHARATVLIMKPGANLCVKPLEGYPRKTFLVGERPSIFIKFAR